jgi:DNA-binding response OmpR family regulator
MSDGTGAGGGSIQFRPVLVVEDDPTVRQALKWTLEEEGIPVTVASTGRRAIELAAAERPGLVLLDIGLPDIPGGAVADGVRSTAGDVPILVMSADGRAAEKAAQVGAVGYFSKPFELDELVVEVRRILTEG